MKQITLPLFLFLMIPSLVFSGTTWENVKTAMEMVMDVLISALR